MLLQGLLWGLLFLSATLARSPKRHYRSSSSSSSNSDSDTTQAACTEYEGCNQPIQLFPDVGSYPFQFAGPGPACQTFFTSSSQSTFAYVFDCFCNGDAFMLLINGQAVPTSFELDCQAGSTACGTYESDARTCALSSNFCNSGWVEVPPGVNNITISTVVAPFNHGQGYIALFGACGRLPCCAVDSISDCNFDQVELTYPYC